MPLPTFLIAGAMKCGTTSLASWLREHPDVFVPAEKELHFFTQRWDRGQEWYAGRFAEAGSARAIGEATPTYVLDPEAQQRIHGLIPDVKLIVLVREPVDRAYSHHTHWRRKGERRSFADAVADELALESPPATHEWDPARPGEYGYLEPGRYARQLERLAAVFPREQVLVLFTEDLQRDPRATFGRVCDFLGIANIVPANVGSVENPSVVLRPRWLFRLLLAVRFGRWAPKRLGRWMFTRMARPDTVTAPLDDALRARLREHFAEDNAALSAWLDTHLPANWSLPARVDAR